MKRTVRSDFGEVYIREDGVIHARLFSNVEVDLEKAKQYHSLIEYMSESKPHCTVIDISGVKTITKEARNFLQKNSSEWGKTIAVGLVTNGFAARVMGNFFLTANKPNYPIKIFSDTLEATQWARHEYLKNLTKIAS